MSALIHGVHDALTTYLQAPGDPSAPANEPTKSINTLGILKFVAVFLVPPLLAALAIVLLGHAFQGSWSRAMTKIAVAMVALVVLGAAGTLFAFGSGLVDVLFK